MATKVLIKRGDYASHNVILSDGEMAYARKKREFFIGDGKTPMTSLKPFNGVVRGDNGYMYVVSVDKYGKPHAELMCSKFDSYTFEFKCPND